MDWAGSFAVIVGCSLTTAFGDHSPKTFKSQQILCLYGQAPFLVVLFLLSALFIVTILITHVFPERVPVGWRLVSVVYIPSYLCGVQTISFKSMSELTANAAMGTSNEWATWPPWLFVFLVVVISVV